MSLLLVLVRIVVGIALITAPVLSIFHVVVAAALYSKLRNFNLKVRVIGLLIVCKHCEFSINDLVLVDTEGFGDEESRLVPVRGWVFGPCVQRDCLVSPREMGVEVHRVAVKNCCLLHRVGEFEDDGLKALNGHRLEIELSLEGNVCKTLLRVVSV